MRYEHSRWHVRAVLLESCQGKKNAWSAHRHKLFRVSPEQLLMATITDRVADDVIQKEFRTFSATDGQGFPKCLNVSRDLATAAGRQICAAESGRTSGTR